MAAAVCSEYVICIVMQYTGTVYMYERIHDDRRSCLAFLLTSSCSPTNAGAA